MLDRMKKMKALTKRSNKVIPLIKASLRKKKSMQKRNSPIKTVKASLFSMKVFQATKSDSLDFSRP